MTRASRRPAAGGEHDDSLYVLIRSGPPLTGDRYGRSNARTEVTATYRCPHEARRVFIDTRLRPETEWAELVAVDGRGSMRRLAWFGPGRDPLNRQEMEPIMRA